MRSMSVDEQRGSETYNVLTALSEALRHPSGLSRYLSWLAEYIGNSNLPSAIVNACVSQRLDVIKLILMLVYGFKLNLPPDGQVTCSTEVRPGVDVTKMSVVVLRLSGSVNLCLRLQTVMPWIIANCEG